LKVLKHIIMYPIFQNEWFSSYGLWLCLLLVPFLPRQQSNNEQVFMGGLPGLTIVQNSLLTMPFCCHWYSIVNYLFTLFLTSLSSLCGMHVHMACPTLLSLPPSLPSLTSQIVWIFQSIPFLALVPPRGLTIGCENKKTIHLIVF